MIWHSARLTRRKRKSGEVSAIPIGASSNAERKRSSASASAAWERMRSATSRTVAWLSTTSRVPGSRTTRRRVSTHTEPLSRRMRWVTETGASSGRPVSLSTAATPAASSGWTRSVNARPSSASGSSPSRSRQAGDA